SKIDGDDDAKTSSTSMIDDIEKILDEDGGKHYNRKGIL
ncbi:hypothetical protein A2U01_0117063, partial [Trifolium medium]|nr:hypothetical protein [Trifolium medium]